MKIALVARHATPPTHSVDPYSADQAAHIDGLSRALAAQGHHVVVYARKDSPELPATARIAPRLRVQYITAGPQSPVPADELPQYVKDIASHLVSSWSKDKPDIVHAFHWTSGLAALGAARACPVPVTVTFGSLGTAERRHRIAGENPATRIKMESCVAKNAASVLAITSDEVAELSRLGIPNARVSVVPLGVDVSRFKPDGLVAKRKRQARLVAVGPLAEYRSLDSLLRCLTELPGAELVIAGGPPAESLEADHGYRILAKLAAELGVTDRVQFTGHVSDANLPALLRSADVLVSSARYEPHAITALRAMACGVPVIAPAIGIYRDAVVDGTTGMLIPPGRPDMLARRLRDLLANPMRLAAYGIAAADRARSRYPWERVASELVTSYERALARAPQPEAAACAATVSSQPVSPQPVSPKPGKSIKPAAMQLASSARPTARMRPALVRASGHAA